MVCEILPSELTALPLAEWDLSALVSCHSKILLDLFGILID